MRMCGRFATRSRRLAGHGLGSGRYFRRTTPRRRQAPHSTRRLSSQCSFTASKTWNLTKTALARLEGFHIRAAYQMAKVHKPRRGPNHVWVYPASSDMLKECRMHTIKHYISVRRGTILQYMVDRPIYEPCKVGERRRGSAPRQ